MATQVQLRGGTSLENANFVGAEREVTVDTTTNTLIVHDGVTPGGHRSATQGALDAKVDKVAGKGLSTNDLTDPLYDKLVGLEGTHWRGTFPSPAALQAGVTDPEAGDYADVDVVGDDVVRYIWDATDGIWVAQSGAAAPITAAQVKMLYESNPNTNAFTDADEAKLEGIAAEATKNATDAFLLSRENHTGVQPISTVTGLQGELDDINLLIGDIASALDAINGEVI